MKNSVVKKSYAHKTIQRFLGTSAMAAFGVLAMAASPAYAIDDFTTPVGEQVIGGSAGFDRPGAGQLNINQNTDRVVINWDSFNIGAQATTEFFQPGAGSLAVNRVTGNHSDPTQILGTLKANGRIMVLDRNGVFFGQNAVLDVGGIVASTGDIDVGAVMRGDSVLQLSDFGDGSVINEGMINVAQAGLAAFVAPHVANNGIINVRFGKVALAAGAEKATVDLYGDGLVELTVTDKAAKVLAENNGTINAQGGHVLVTAATAKDMVDNVINMNGVTQVSSVEVKGGKIILHGGNKGTVSVGGTLDATGTTGGDIEVTGQNVELRATANLDASGTNGGGEILVGGNYLGGGDTPRSEFTFVQDGALIRNDALENGDGGKTIFWSDGTTFFAGNTSAKGGANGGNGGFVEVSGLEGLMYQGFADLSAANGETGTLLFDPRDIDFRLGIRGVDIWQFSGVADLLDGSISASTSPSGGTFRIYESDIETISLFADIELVARRNFTVNKDVYRNVLFGPTLGTAGVHSDGVVNIWRGNSLTISTLNDNGNAGVIDLTGNDFYGADLEFRTTDTIFSQGNITINAATDGGATGDIILSKLTSREGDVNINTGNGTVTWNGDVTSRGGNINSAGARFHQINSTLNSGGGNIDLTTVSTGFPDQIILSGGANLLSNGGNINLDSRGAGGGAFIQNGTVDARGTTTDGNVNINARQWQARSGSQTFANNLDVQGGLVTQSAASTITADTLTGSLAATALFAGTNNQINTLGNFETGTANWSTGGFTLVNSETLAVSGDVSSTGGDIDIRTTGKDLEVKSTASVLSNGGAISLQNNNGRLIINSNVDTQGGDATLTSAGNVQIWNGGTLSADTLTANSSRFQQWTGSTITANTLTGSTIKDANFAGTNNQINTLGNFATGTANWSTGGFTLVDNGGLNVTGDVSSTGGDIRLSNNGTTWDQATSVTGSILSGGGDISALNGRGQIRLQTGALVDGQGGNVTFTNDDAFTMSNGATVKADTLSITGRQVQQNVGAVIEANTLTGSMKRYADFLGTGNQIGALGNFAVGTATWYNDAKGFQLVDNGGLTITGAVSTTGGDIDIQNNSAAWNEQTLVSGSLLSEGGDITVGNTSGAIIMQGGSMIDSTDAAGNGDVELNAGSNITLQRTARVNAGTLTLDGTQVAQQANSVIIADTLQGAARTYAEFLGTGNQINTLGNFATGTASWHNDAKGFQLVNGVNLAVDGLVSTTDGDIIVNNTGNLDIVTGGAFDAGAGNILLVQSGTFSSTDADTLRTSAGTITTNQNNDGDIQDNIDAVENTGNGLNTINVSGGSFTAIDVYEDNFLVRGANEGLTGWDTTRTAETVINGASPAATLSGNNITLDGVTLSGGFPGALVSGTNIIVQNNIVTGQTGGALGDGVRVNGGTDVTVTRNAINNNQGDGIDVRNSFGTITLTNNRIDNTGANGVRVHNTADVSVTDNIIHTTGQSGIQASAAQNTTITGNFVGYTDAGTTSAGDDNIATHGISVVNGSDDAQISGNKVVDTASNGVRTLNSGNTQIINNQIASTATNGILVQDGTSAATISQNIVSETGLNGIRLVGTAGSMIANNTVTNAATNGISVSASNSVNRASGTVVRENTVTDSGQSGIDVLNSDFVTIGDGRRANGNTVTGAVTGVSITGGTDVFVSNNVIRNPSSGGTIANNDGVNVNGSQNVRIRNNLITGMLDDGIDLNNGSSDAVVQSNTINRAGNNGIELSGGSNNAMIGGMRGNNGNIINGQSGTETDNGIVSLDADFVSILNNRVQRVSNNGIQVDQNGETVSNNVVFRTGNDGMNVADSGGVSVANNWVGQNRRGRSQGTDNIGNDGIVVSNSDGANVTNNNVRQASNDGIVIVGNGAYDVSFNSVRNSNADGIDVDGAGNVTITANDVFFNGGNGITISDTDQATLTDNYVYWNASNGILADDVDQVTIIENDIFLNGGNGIALSNTDKVTITENDISVNAANGIVVDGAEQAEIIQNDVFLNGGNGIALRNTDKVTITENDVSVNAADGIWVDSAEQVEITQNDVFLNGGNGIFVDNVNMNSADFVNISGNNAHRNGSEGIFVDESNNVTITDNEVYGNRSDGIEVDDSNNVTITDNEVYDNGSEGIELDRSNNVTISGNEVYDNGTEGIELDNTDNVTITGNEVYDNGSEGMDIDESDNLTISGNFVYDNRSDGIEVDDSNNVTISGNEVYDNGTEGLDVTNTTGLLTVSNNMIYDNGRDGVDINDAQDVSFIGNQITGNDDTGAIIEDTTGAVTISDNSFEGNGEDGLSVIDATGTLVISLNNADNNALSGVILRNVQDARLEDNTMENNGDNGLYVSGGTNGDVVISGNTFTDNPTGVRVESGTIDLTGDTNFVNGGDIGMLFDRFGGTAAMALVSGPSDVGGTSGTFGTTEFSGQSDFFIALDNNAFSLGAGVPLVLDGSFASYDGFSPNSLTRNAAGVPLFGSAASLSALQARFFDFVNDNTLGLILLGTLPELDQEDFLTQFGGFDAGAGNLSVSLNGFPTIPGQPVSLADTLNALEPAAGGTLTAEELAGLEPAAGGSGEAENEVGCWGDAVSGAQGGGTTTFSFGNSLEQTLSGEAGCASTL